MTEIADALGDVDGYAARFTPEEQGDPAIAADIAQRLLAAGRLDSAMVAVERAEKAHATGRAWPDFEDEEAETRAIAHARSFAGFHQGLAFLVNWPAHDAAAAHAVERHGELDGDHYWLLTPAADALEQRHPLAATLMLRAMIGFAARTTRAATPHVTNLDGDPSMKAAEQAGHCGYGDDDFHRFQ